MTFQAIFPPSDLLVLPPYTLIFLGQNEFHVIMFLSIKYIIEHDLILCFCNTSHAIAFINK